MKLLSEVSAQKLRGGFYTNDELVDWCLRRVAALTDVSKGLHVLEPSAGDGAFIRGLSRMAGYGWAGPLDVTCVELLESEAQECAHELARLGVAGEVINDSFFSWAKEGSPRFDAVVGNPPFVRYQFVPEEDRAAAEWLLGWHGVDFDGVSNLWIPFTLLSIFMLRPGGVFAMVLPSELFSTISASTVRSQLVQWLDSIRVDLFPRDSFPELLQDVLVVSGVRASERAQARTVTFSERGGTGSRQWNRMVQASGKTWTGHLLSDREWQAYCSARSLTAFHDLSEIARIEVSVVTGANGFFTVSDETCEKHGLGPWARPLLARTGHCRGILVTEADHKQARREGRKVWLLDFSAHRADPMLSDGPRAYIRLGESRGLPGRYKCRIRSPWYRVPHIRNGSLMMAKRAHQHHRLMLNEAGVFTTDTIYRGEMLPPYKESVCDLVAGFHNSLTLLSAEVEGRSYGGGVLELVPSEIARLVVPLTGAHAHLGRHDGISRGAGGQLDPTNALVHATDELLARVVPGLSHELPALDAARMRLQKRRFHG